MGHDLLDIWDKTCKTVFFITHSLTEAIYLSDLVLVMSPRPGRIVDTIAIDLPRPRDLDLIGSETFGRLRNRIWHLIAEQPVMHAGRHQDACSVALVMLALWEVARALRRSSARSSWRRRARWSRPPLTDGRTFLRPSPPRVIEIGAAIAIAWTLGIVLGVVVGSSLRAGGRRPRRCSPRSSPFR